MQAADEDTGGSVAHGNGVLRRHLVLEGAGAGGAVHPLMLCALPLVGLDKFRVPARPQLV